MAREGVGLQGRVKGERGSSSAVCLHSLRLKWSLQQHSQLNQELEAAREPDSHVPGLQKDYISHLALKRKLTPSGNSFTIQVPKLINVTISRILKCKKMTSFLFFELACLSVFADLFMGVFLLFCLRHYHIRPSFGFRDKGYPSTSTTLLSVTYCFKHQLFYPVRVISVPAFLFWNINF